MFVIFGCSVKTNTIFEMTRCETEKEAEEKVAEYEQVESEDGEVMFYDYKDEKDWKN